MGKPFREGLGWAFRLQAQGQDIYQSGYPSSAAASKAQTEILVELRNQDKAAGQGPFRTSVAAAFTSYARERLPFLKGAPSDVGRINRYLRALGLPVIRLKGIDEPSDGSKVYWTVSFAHERERTIPNSLKAHRTQQEQQSFQCDNARRRLAQMMMADVTTYEIQRLVDAMRSAGYSANTISLERAELRRLFNYARRQLKWTRPGTNPASDLTLPAHDRPRDVVLTNEQWRSMSEALCEAGNEYAPPLFCLMLETAMRSCEPLTYARWRHVNWERMLLELPDAKTGKREVPLGPGALDILRMLLDRAMAKGNAKPRAKKSIKPFSLDDKIFPTTYEAVKKAWSVARKACGLGDVRMHDLRHTAATRYALQFKGNLPVIMKITGHATVEMALRYINLKAEEVAGMLHDKEPPVGKLAAGYQVSAFEVLKVALKKTTESSDGVEAADLDTPAAASSNVAFVDFSRRAA